MHSANYSEIICNENIDGHAYNLHINKSNLLIPGYLNLIKANILIEIYFSEINGVRSLHFAQRYHHIMQHGGKPTFQGSDRPVICIQFDALCSLAKESLVPR